MSRKKSVDPELLLQEIVAGDFDLTKFRQVDESDIVQPANFFEWITGRDFCNASILPWQVEQGMKLFSDYCPTCSNPEYVSDLYDETIAEIQDNITFLVDGVCPKCKHNRIQLFRFDGGPGPHFKNEYVSCLGQRSGKSKSVALYTSYQINRWLALPDPLQFYGLPPMEIVMGTFSALSADQAEENLWIPFRGLYDQAPWFIKYNEFLKSEEKRLSIPLADIKETYLFYPHKRFMCGFTGSDDRKKRGRTRLFGVIDEIAFLNSEAGSKRKIMDADKNYAALNNSLSTIRQKAMKKLQDGYYNTNLAIMHNASSPYNALDKIMRLVKGANEWTQVIHKATWECVDGGTFIAAKQGLLRAEQDITATASGAPVEQHRTDAQEVFRLETRAGLYLEASANHAIKVFNRHEGICFKPLSEISVEDDLAIIDATPQPRPERPEVLVGNVAEGFRRNKHLFRWLGMVSAEGTDTEADLLKCMEGDLSSFLIDTPVTDTILQYCSLKSAAPYEKATPGIVFTASEVEVAFYLQGLFEGGGWVGNEYIGFVSTSETLIFETQVLLLTLGIFSQKTDRPGRNGYELNITSNDVLRFAEKIGFVSLKKSEHLDKILVKQCSEKQGLANLVFEKITAIKPTGRRAALVDFHVADPSHCYWSNGFTSHNCNPDYTYESTRQQNSALSQVEFERDFGAVPPFSDSPYIGDARVMEKLCQPSLPKVIEAVPQTFTDQMGDRYLYLEARIPRLDKMTPRLLALDNGYKQNAFGVVLFHYDFMSKKPVLDFAMSLYPQPEQGLNIHFPMMYDHFIMPLVRNLRIQQVFYDRWQSLDQIQRLREQRVDAQAHSLSYDKDFLPFRQQLMSGNLILPPCEIPVEQVKESANPLALISQHPITNLIWQTLTVREVGKKITKPLEGDDDLFRAFVLGGSRFLDEDVKRKYITMGGVNQAVASQAVGSFSSFRGNQAGISPTSNQPNRAALYARIRTRSKK